MRWFLTFCLIVVNIAIISAQTRRRFKLDNNIRRTSKTRGVNGGHLYFDEESGEFKKRPTHHDDREESAEVIARTRVRNFDNSDGDRMMSKVLKRRKKYKKLPVQAAQLVNKKEQESDEGEFTKLSPLKSKYKTSDTIRMHLRRTVDAKKEEISSPKRRLKQKDENHDNKDTDDIHIKSPGYDNLERPTSYRNSEPKTKKDSEEIDLKHDRGVRPQELLKQKRKPDYVKLDRSKSSKKQNVDEIKSTNHDNSYKKRKHGDRGRNNLDTQDVSGLKIESRENVYEHYDSPEEVLLTSGYHNQISVQDPNYDFTIGDTQRYPSAPQDPILNHQFLPTPPPVNYPAYSGLYFPPTSEEEEKSNLKNYDFTIGDTGNIDNPVLDYLNLSPKQPARLPTTPKPFVPTRSPVRTTTLRMTPEPTAAASRRSHTTESIPATGHRFPHFPSIEITDNYIDTFNARKADKKQYKVNKFDNYRSFTTTTRKPKEKQQSVSRFYNTYNDLQNYETTKKPSKSKYFNDFNAYESYPDVRNTPDHFKSASNFAGRFTTKQTQRFSRTYQTTTKSSNSLKQKSKISKAFESFGPSSMFSNNNDDFFSDWGKKVDSNENNIKREISNTSPIITTIKPKIKEPVNNVLSANTDDEIYELKNYRTPVGAYPGMYSNSNNQGYDNHAPGTGHTASPYPPNENKYTSYPAPKIQTTPTTIYTNTPISYTAEPGYPDTANVYTPVPAFNKNTPKSWIGQPSPTPLAPVQKSHHLSQNKFNHFTTPNPYKLKRGPLRQELTSNTKLQQKPHGFNEPVSRFYSGYGGFGPSHIKPHQPAITFLEPSPSALVPETYQQPLHQQVETQRAQRVNPTDVFSQPAAFDGFFEYPSFDQRMNPENSFSQFDTRIGSGWQQQARNQYNTQNYQQSSRPQDNIRNGQRSAESDELPRRKRNRDPTSVNPNKRGKRKRKTAQFDNRPQGGYSISVFDNAGKNYSIRDGNFNEKSKPIFGNSNIPEQQFSAMNKPRQFKRNVGQHQQRTEGVNPWPNDKHWSNQQYESQELGDNIPFLF